MTDRYQRSDTVLWRRTSDAVVLLPGDASDATILSGTAVAVWDHVDPPASAQEVAGRVASALGIDREACAADIAALLASLRDGGALKCWT